MKKIILASSSPRRKNLLNQVLRNKFSIVESRYEEDNDLKMPPTDLVLHHSLNKAVDVAKRVRKGIIIGADTIVVLNKKVLGKPKTKDNATRMLKSLSGRWHEVITGIAVIDFKNESIYRDYDVARVKFKKLSAKEIKSYVDTGEPLDKAGAYAIQEKGALIVERIEGDYFNVEGLPLYKLSLLLKKAGVDLFCR